MLKRLIDITVSALFGAFLVVFCILVWSASSCEPTKKENESTAQKSPEKIRCEDFNPRNIQCFGIWMASHPNETAAGVTALATAVIGWFTIILTRIGRRQAADNRALQRAFVFVNKFHMDIVPQDGQPTWWISVDWFNGGNTETKNFFNRINARTFDGDIPDDYTFPVGFRTLKNIVVFSPSPDQQPPRGR